MTYRETGTTITLSDPVITAPSPQLHAKKHAGRD
jgi:hypothetical protein